MLSNKTTIFLFLISWGLMSNDDYYKPVTLLNVAIYIEKGTSNDTLHIFFIRGELSFTTRSLQYYFFDKLQLTNVRLTRPSQDDHIKTFEDLKDLLEQLVMDEDEMKKIREKARLTIRPFVYRFKSKDGDQAREEVDLMKLEMELGRRLFELYRSSFGAFVLFGNYFKQEGTWVYVPLTPLATSSYMRIFVQRYIYSTTADTDTGKQIIPIAFAITNDDHSIPENTKGKLSKFNAVKINGVWGCPYLMRNADGSRTWNILNILENSAEWNSLKLLESIFSSEGEATTTTPAWFTNFITYTFFYTLMNLIEHDITQKEGFKKILYKIGQGDVSVTFDDIKDDTELEESMRGKYNVVGDLKASFSDDVLLTSVNPFTKNEYEPAITSTEKSSSTSATNTTSTDKKEGMSGGMITLILIPILVVLVAIGVLGWYYFVKIRGKTSKRGRKFGK